MKTNTRLPPSRHLKAVLEGIFMSCIVLQQPDGATNATRESGLKRGNRTTFPRALLDNDRFQESCLEISGILQLFSPKPRGKRSNKDLKASR